MWSSWSIGHTSDVVVDAVDRVVDAVDLQLHKGLLHAARGPVMNTETEALHNRGQSGIKPKPSPFARSDSVRLGSTRRADQRRCRDAASSVYSRSGRRLLLVLCEIYRALTLGKVKSQKQASLRRQAVTKALESLERLDTHFGTNRGHW